MKTSSNIAAISVTFLLMIAVGLTGCRRQPQQPDGTVQQESKPVELTPEQKAFLANQKSYTKAKMSVEAPTFEGAELILGQINDADITDADLASYVALCKKIASFSADLGIPRESGTGFADIIKNLDYAAILKHLTSKGITNALSEAARLVSEALKIKNQLPIWEDLDASLSEKYSE
ncbi:MAG: hypothetical protein IPK22_06825 [Verrucomicrobiaceae bacterium]|nr:hypothetical protein [Verrucomicrobiaceae bacterium]